MHSVCVQVIVKGYEPYSDYSEALFSEIWGKNMERGRSDDEMNISC